MDRSKIVLVSALIGAVVLTNTGQFALQYYYKDTMKETYEQKLRKANATLDKLGGLVLCKTVAEPVEPGDIVDADSLEDIYMPEASVTDNYILDDSDVDGDEYRIAVNKGTPLTTDMLMKDELDDTSREYDIALDSLPTGTKVGDYIDIRIVQPKGEDYVVLSHKRVQGITPTTVKLIINELEIHRYRAAQIDQFINDKFGASIYADKYTDPGIQRPADVYYTVPDNIADVIERDPNIINDIADPSVSRDMIERQLDITDEKLGSALGTGRTQYQAKLDQARDFFTENTKDSANEESLDDAEEIPEDSADSSK